MQLIYIHSTKCDSDLKAHEVPSIQFWNSDDIKRRETFELNNGGFGNLDLYLDVDNDNESYKKKVFLYL